MTIIDVPRYEVALFFHGVNNLLLDGSNILDGGSLKGVGCNSIDFSILDVINDDRVVDVV